MKRSNQRKLEIAPGPALQTLLTKIKSTATEKNPDVNKKLFAELALEMLLPFRQQILRLVKQTKSGEEFEREFRRQFRVEFVSKGDRK